MIKLQIIGHLGKDAETRDANGTPVINFSVAHTEKYKDQTKTIWVECSKFGEKTGIAAYLKKGTQVFVEGQPEVRTWSKDGKSGASLTLRVNSIQLLGSGNGQQEATATNEAAPALEPFTDLPF